MKSDNFGKYRKALSMREIGIVQAAAGETMRALGYELDAVPTPRQPPLSRSLYGLMDVVWQLKVEVRRCSETPTTGGDGDEPSSCVPWAGDEARLMHAWTD